MTFKQQQHGKQAEVTVQISPPPQRSDDYSAQVLLNNQQVWCGVAYLHRYQAERKPFVN